MSIIIESYLRQEDGEFTLAESWNAPISDHEYLEGALKLTINDTPIITLTMWDYIDELWAYVINTLQELASGDSVHMYFPDQPIKLEMKRTPPNMILVSISPRSGKFDNSAWTHEGDFVHQLLDAGEKFFTKMSKLDPAGQGQYEHDIERIKEVRHSFSR